MLTILAPVSANEGIDKAIEKAKAIRQTAIDEQNARDEEMERQRAEDERLLEMILQLPAALREAGIEPDAQHRFTIGLNSYSPADFKDKGGFPALELAKSKVTRQLKLAGIDVPLTPPASPQQAFYKGEMAAWHFCSYSENWEDGSGSTRQSGTRRVSIYLFADGCLAAGHPQMSGGNLREMAAASFRRVAKSVTMVDAYADFVVRHNLA